MTPEQRENLKRLLAPRHIAFIGGASAAHAAGQCARTGFDGAIWGVNPRRDELGGQPCFARVEDLPEAPDAVFLATPLEAVLETTAALRRAEAGGVVCYTAGFGELGGEGIALEQALVEAAGDLALVGPNCLGVINYLRSVALWPFGHGGKKIARGIALVSQSGLMGSNLSMNQRSADFSHIVSLGNQACLGIEDFIEVLIEDPGVASIGLYIEGLRDIPRFAEVALRALQANIPIVALKAGSSDIGAQLTQSHTGSLSGSDVLYQALFDRLGIIRVESTTLLLETLKMLTVAGAPKGPRIATFTCSGGDSTLLADGAAKAGLQLPKPTEEAAAALTASLPPIASVANPLDYTTPLWGKEAELTRVFDAMFTDSYDAALIVLDYMSADFEEDNEFTRADSRAFIDATRRAGIPAAVCSGLPENLPEPDREVMRAGRVAPLQGLSEALQAIAAAGRYGAYREQVLAAGNPDALALPVLAPLVGEAATLDEWQGKKLLAEAGVPIPRGALASKADAGGVAETIGFPVAVKLVSAALPHKTEAGAVKLNLKSKEEADQALAEIEASVATAAPTITYENFLIEQMIPEPVAEILVGVRRDPAFGQALVLASGGILVELVADSATLLLPCDRQNILSALQSLKVFSLIAGYRDRPAGDLDALLDAIVAVAAFAESHRDSLEELDINPLMILPAGQGVVAVDVLLRMA